MSENKMENIRNHFCEGEIEAFKICNDIGQRNYRNSQRFKKEGESFPDQGGPLGSMGRPRMLTCIFRNV